MNAELSPEFTRASPGAPYRFWQTRPVSASIWLTLAISLLLQAWRPFFHLTDDNFSGWLPVQVEFYQRLWSGQWPFHIPSLLDGGYDLLKDPTVTCLLSPWGLLFSWLALTPYYYLLADVVSTLDLLTMAAAFAWFACRLRDRFSLTLPDGAIVFATLSYVFTPFNLLVGPCWMGTLNPQVTLPLIIAGWWSASFWRGAGVITGALLFSMYGGHMHSFVYMLLFSGLFAAANAALERTWQPLLRLAAGGLIALLASAPIVLPTLSGFGTSARAQVLKPAIAMIFRVPPADLFTSFFVGPIAFAFTRGIAIHFADTAFTVGVAFALVNLPVAVLLARKQTWRPIELAAVICFAIAVVFVIRPLWLEEVLLKLPVFKSLRWPFRELPLLLFFVHLLFLLRFRDLQSAGLKAVTVVSVLGFGLQFLLPAPSFNEFRNDRQMITSGTARQFWKTIQGDGPKLRVVSATPVATLYRSPTLIPFTLLGAYNYASILGITNISGYSPTLPGSGIASDVHPYHHSGMFRPVDAERLRQKDPTLTKVTLLSMHPTLLEVHHGDSHRYFVMDAQTNTVTEVAQPAVSAPAEKK